jgi:hypothetical protein
LLSPSDRCIMDNNDSNRNNTIRPLHAMVQ